MDRVQPSALARDITRAKLELGDIDDSIVTEAEIATLAEPIRRYLRFMGVVGRPRIWSVSARWSGRFRLKPDADWKSCEAWQYDVKDEVARIFRIRIGSMIPVVARDTYVRGHGRLRATVLGVIPLADAEGPELDDGELVTYLNDAILLAPSMLLGPRTTLAPVNDHAFDVAISDLGRTVEARVRIDARGAPLSFSTTDRFWQDPADREHRWQRTRWITPIDEWTEVDGRTVVKRASAVWQLAQGPFTYCELELVPSRLVFNDASAMRTRSFR